MNCFLKKISRSCCLLPCCLLACALTPALAQSPYQLKTGREIGLYGTGLGLLGGGYYFGKKMPPLTPAQVGELNANDLPRFDRWATTQSSVRSRRASDVLLISASLLPAVFALADRPMRGDAATFGVMYSQTIMINGGLTTFIKNTVRRPRPYAYQAGLPIGERTAKDARQSFWSGHTSQAAAMSFLTAQLYADYHPDSKWRPVVWSVAAGLPLATGILRTTAGRHFPTDVLLGYATGAAVGLLVPRLHRK